MMHLTIRVAWHDNRWNGTVCNAPSRNSFCMHLDRIREERDDHFEDEKKGLSWDKLSSEHLPPCKAESGIFMNPQEWIRLFKHPYAKKQKAKETHGHLKPTNFKVLPYSTFAVPFAWMLRQNQKDIDASLPTPLPPDENAPFPTPWVFGRVRQEALLNLFSSRLVSGHSLAFFYCKEGQPFGDSISRLVVGVGRIDRVAKPAAYDSEGKKPTYLMWDLPIQHSIRPNGHEGFLLPYHEYLEPTGDAKEDERRAELLKEILVPADPAHLRVFSYAAELTPADIALSTLARCLESVRRIRAHGIVKGPWELREEWLNTQIDAAWKDRGAFPGLGPVLEAVGMRLGTALVLELMANGTIASDDDPWPIIDSILLGKKKAPQVAYDADLKAVRTTWAGLINDHERRDFLRLLSRFALTPAQAKRWLNDSSRSAAKIVSVKDREIIENPYRMSEIDLGERNDSPLSIGMVDRGLLPDSTIAAKHPVPHPSTVGSPNDTRRIRAAIVEVLRRAAQNGDSLLSVNEVLKAIGRLELRLPCIVGMDWILANRAQLEGVVEIVDVASDTSAGQKIESLQLTELKQREERLRSILARRAEKHLPSISANWKDLLIKAISDAGGKFDTSNTRHSLALGEQADALERLIARKLTVLVGRAGTGKTSILGALMLCEPISNEGILLLAPTGKARVRLGRAASAEAMTIAQFLNRLKRYDGERQRPLFTGKEKYRKEKTVIIDESSMLTMDDLAAVLEALDLAHVQRLILVGDPNQLPPIGVGRPFADLVAFLNKAGLKNGSSPENPDLVNALAHLSVEVRSIGNGEDISDTLRLASWFTQEEQPIDADRVFSNLELGERFNDLELVFWKTPEELRSNILGAFRQHLGLRDENDVKGFEKALGMDERGWVPFDAPEGAERFQILSPVKMHPYGVHELNRWIQRHFRGKELQDAYNPWGTCLGSEEIVIKDKVIQTANQLRDAYNGESSEEYYLANGEVGLVATKKSGWPNVVFAGRPGLSFGYSNRDFPSGSGPLELAYALTVHKAQGSEFRKVFVILPKISKLLSRELLYTALTRSRDQLVLFIEGEDATVLYDLSRPEKSETARRNTNLFQGIVREDEELLPYAEHLIHRSDKGHMVRSKSELVIANMLFQMGIEYHYERVCEGTVEPGRLRPDFSFIAPDGDLIIWEHLGMLNKDDYRRGWEWKRWWYERNGFLLDKILFTTQEDEVGGLDSATLRKIALKIQKLL